MIRVRLDSQLLDNKRLDSLIQIVKSYDLELITTSRGGLELHNIKSKDILEIYKSINQIGFKTHQSLTDNIRSIVTDPYDSISLDSKIECSSIIDSIRDDIVYNKKYFGTLPRKFNTTFIGRVNPLINPWGSDLLFALAKGKEGFGFNIYVGGKNSEVAKSLNIFIYPKDAKKLFFAIVDSFIEFGLRESRAKCRLFYLLEKIGFDEFRKIVQMKFGKPLLKEQILMMRSSKYTLCTPLKNSLYGKVFQTDYGRVDISKLKKILKKNPELKIGADQNIHILNSTTFSNENSSSIIACAGSKYCSLSLWNIKDDVNILNLDRFKKYGIDIGFSGCLKGCGRHHHNHIGFVGLRSNMFGKTSKALRVYIGSTQYPKPTPARLLYYAVPVDKVSKLLDIIIEDFKNGEFKDFDQFNNHLLNFNIETLQLWFLLRALTNFDTNLYKEFYNSNEKELLKLFWQLPIYPKEDSIYKSINILSHKLWDS